MGQTSPGTPRVLRAMNDRAALDLLLLHGPLSRSSVGALTGLSKPTASQLLARLETAGLVVTTGTSEGHPGPGARLYAINPAAAHVAGLDVTATGTRAAVADVTGRVVGRHELPTPAGGPGAHTANELVRRALDGAARAAGVDTAELHHVVVGTPGAFDPHTGRLRYAAHLPGWHSPTLLEELTAALPMPLSHDNDVNLVAVAEQRLGAANGNDDFVLLWIEEGIGAAVVIDGQPHRGWRGGAGEVGFLPVPGADLVRDAARVGSGGFQRLASARAVLRIADEVGLDHGPGEDVVTVAADLLRRAATTVGEGTSTGDHTLGGPHAELLRRFATATAVGLSSIVAVLDPPLVVLSGRVLTAGGEPLRALVSDELRDLAAARPRLVSGAVTEHPVLGGALESALATTRDEVFDTLRRPGDQQ